MTILSNTLAQNSLTENLDKMWSSLVVHAGLSQSDLSKDCPHFPIQNKSVVGVEKWINSYPSEANNFINVLENRDIHVSKTQLGIPENDKSTGEFVPHWQNALNAFGGESGLKRELPNMPAPSDFCNTAGYANDAVTRNKWRSEFGYGSDANDRV
ncbi:MAG: hypothetical protein JKX84_05890, partial [Flavobacteriales bacterium]|nr:hypothetical protein [Flavobacteriales bacterium]